jgi:hypothetical protein
MDFVMGTPCGAKRIERCYPAPWGVKGKEVLKISDDCVKPQLAVDKVVSTYSQKFRVRELRS